MSKKLQDTLFLGEETRKNHTAHYPWHNRYFSNGDKPWVVLVNTKNNMKLTYTGKEHTFNSK